MSSEHDKTLEALKIAMEMEEDGKEWYLQASLKSYNESGRLLLEALADEEDEHRRKFEQIYEAIRAEKSWPPTDFRVNGSEPLRAKFTRTCVALGADEKPVASELDIIKTAIDNESKSCDFYNGQARVATYDSERAFYNALYSQENEHHLVLLDYYELMTDPAGWFLRKEHQSLDG